MYTNEQTKEDECKGAELSKKCRFRRLAASVLHRRR